MSYQTKPIRLASFESMIKSNWKTMLFKLLSKRRLQPTALEYVAIQQALQRGDEAMDLVVAWVMQNPQLHRQYFETALYQGTAKLPHDILVLQQFFRSIETPPTWLDPQKMQQAITFSHRLGINNGFVLRDLSLMVGYLYPGFNQVLLKTGALKKQAGKRLAETTQWWMSITEANAFSRFNEGFTSTIYVRFIHAMVRYHLHHDEQWDEKRWGCPINQFDLALTNIAFSETVLLGIRGLGIFPNRAESNSFLHFWRYVAWLMGVDEQWCIEHESEGIRLLYWLQFAHPAADQSSIALATSLSMEPFERQYLHFRPLQQKLAYREHLDITQFFIGRKGMQRLGLPHRSVAWFAYYLILRNSILYSSARFSPRIDQFLVQKGRMLQKIAAGIYKRNLNPSNSQETSTADVCR